LQMLLEDDASYDRLRQVYDASHLTSNV
jgi:hypothetical protein